MQKKSFIINFVVRRLEKSFIYKMYPIVLTIFILLILIILLIAIIVNNALFWIQQKVLFQPSIQNYWMPPFSDNIHHLLLHHSAKYSPKKLFFTDYPLKLRTTFDEYLHVIHFNQFPNRKTILFCHGNAGNNSHRKYMYDLASKLNLNLLLFDYRGFGFSNGYASKFNLIQDSQLCYNYLLTFGLTPTDIIIWGESLGGHPALYTASKNPCYALILCSTFSSLSDLILETSAFNTDSAIAKGIKSLLPTLISDIQNVELTPLITVPVVIIHSKEDNLIPMSCATKLYNSIGHDQKKVIKIKGLHAIPKIGYKDITCLFNFLNIDIPILAKHDIRPIVKELKTMVKSQFGISTTR